MSPRALVLAAALLCACGGASTSSEPRAVVDSGAPAGDSGSDATPSDAGACDARTVHSDGLTGSWSDCTPIGTHDEARAMAACGASTLGGRHDEETPLGAAVCDGAGQVVCWVYAVDVDAGGRSGETIEPTLSRPRRRSRALRSTPGSLPDGPRSAIGISGAPTETWAATPRCCDARYDATHDVAAVRKGCGASRAWSQNGPGRWSQNRPIPARDFHGYAGPTAKGGPDEVPPAASCKAPARSCIIAG